MPQIARGYAERDERVHYSRQPFRLGLVGAWRRALELAPAPPGAELVRLGLRPQLPEAGWLEVLWRRRYEHAVSPRRQRAFSWRAAPLSSRWLTSQFCVAMPHRQGSQIAPRGPSANARSTRATIRSLASLPVGQDQPRAQSIRRCLEAGSWPSA
jgi:hypothetical protein